MIGIFPICAVAVCEACLGTWRPGEGRRNSHRECLMSAIQRMIDEMRRRGYAAKTIAEYSGSVRRLASYFGCCPSELSLEQLREYQVHLARRKDISVSYYNATVTALRFMYLQTLDRDWSIERLPYGRREHRLPVVLSRQEVFQLWRAAPSAEASAAVDDGLLGRSADFRAGSSARGRFGRPADADPRPTRRAQTGWHEPRLVPYSPTLKRLMGPYLAKHDSPGCFRANSQARPLTTWAARNICVHAARLGRLGKSVTITMLRHSAAVHWWSWESISARSKRFSATVVSARPCVTRC